MSPTIVDMETARLVSVNTADPEDRTAQTPVAIIPMHRLDVLESSFQPLLRL